jgi:acyl-CoA synthetase (AMP-forming)/AMP-acid ligase II
VVLMSPESFLERPMRWLEAIARYQATVSGGPNFAYELCARKSAPHERERLDLRSWQVAFSGAEPVRADTLERFAAAFAGAGFRREVFYPCYGLAEATLIVSGGRKDEAPVVRRFDRQALAQGQARDAPAEQAGVELVSAGQAMPGILLGAVRPETHEPCAEGEVGEIWVRGASVARGYWGRPEEAPRPPRRRWRPSGRGARGARGHSSARAIWASSSTASCS